MSDIKIVTDKAASSTTLSFTVTGASGTTGYGNITIPKSAVVYGTIPTVSIDGSITSNQGYTQDTTNYYVWYTSTFSTHQISITFTTVSSATPTPTAGPGSTSRLHLWNSCCRCNRGNYRRCAVAKKAKHAKKLSLVNSSLTFFFFLKIFFDKSIEGGLPVYSRQPFLLMMLIFFDCCVLGLLSCFLFS